MRWLSVKEFGQEYQLHSITVYRLCEKNVIPHIKLGGSIRIPDTAYELMQMGIGEHEKDETVVEQYNGNQVTP